MRIFHQLRLAFKQRSLRRLVRMLTIQRRLAYRNRIPDIPNFLRPKGQSSLETNGGSGPISDAKVTMRMQTTRGEIYVYSDGTRLDFRKKPVNPEVTPPSPTDFH